jgi:hypothetical protein
MIVRFFKTGQSNGEAPVNYLLRLRDHTGEPRPEQPEILEGNPRLTIALINGISRQHKYSSGCLAFKAGEEPSKAELHTIIDKFKAVVAPGLDPDQFNSLFVLHREPPDRKTGLSSFHVHFVMPMTILAGMTATGKDLTGRRWNPHPPGKQTIETMALFTQITNYENGWAQVTEKPLRVVVDSFWRKAGNTSNAEKAELLRKELNKAIRNGQINSRDELCTYMDQLLGLTITRTGKDYVSVKFPDGAKAVRLKGAMFDSQTDYATLRSATTQSHGTEKFSVPEYQQARTRLACLLSYRANELSGNGSARKPKTITTKENNYGTHKKRLGRINGSSAEHQRGDSIYVPTSGMERNLFQESSGQRRHTHDGGRQESHGGPQKNTEPNQHAFHANSGNAGTKRGRGAGGFQPTYGQTLNEQIRELGIQLLECEQYSQEAAAIMAKINALVGAREQLPRGPKFMR